MSSQPSLLILKRYDEQDLVLPDTKQGMIEGLRLLDMAIFEGEIDNLQRISTKNQIEVIKTLEDEIIDNDCDSDTLEEYHESDEFNSDHECCKRNCQCSGRDKRKAYMWYKRNSKNRCVH